ncbi:MAG TPA: PCP reductase family protein [Candidatus Methylomirabilis sp.]|jgi:hypothetical protein|nr:PCP reductase family protein [Candidatus Methylomirabilis sp.]
MKFLCVACDAPMALESARGPEAGSITAVFSCPACGRQVAMLTNPFETQLIKSMDVRLGGPAGPPEPLGFLTSALGSGKGEGDASGDTGTGPGCPFGGMVAAMGSGVGREEDGTPDGPLWTDEAAERLNRIPGFVRGMAKKGIEQFARERGYPRITGAVMDEARGALGM